MVPVLCLESKVPMGFSITTQSATPGARSILQRRISPRPKTHGRRFSCRVKNAYRGLQVENPGLRFYSANFARWMCRDPIEERGGKNLYVFSKDNPVKYVDARGLCCNVDSFEISFRQKVQGVELGSVTMYHLYHLIGFTAKLSNGSDPKDCVIRQWVKGSVLTGDGPMLMPLWQIDAKPSFPYWDGHQVSYWDGGPNWYGGKGRASVSPNVVLSPAWVSATRSFYFYDSPGMVLAYYSVPGSEDVHFRTEIIDKTTHVVQAFRMWSFTSSMLPVAGVFSWFMNW